MTFNLGQIVLTRGVNDLIADSTQAAKDYLAAMARHRGGDWGDLDAEDKAANDFAIGKYLRIFSAYKLDGRKVWIITEADRSVTTTLFPEEY
tara:strand:+ start:181 stop:456 length:276 start_codon:yes stop_codon:yes gene_type:complete